MRRKIPSTGALIAFEAAGRHQNFSRAAEELALTEGAISRQIAVLEAYLGLPLFHRIKKRVALSDIGHAYFIQVKEDLHRLEQNTINTINVVRRQHTGKVIELAVIPTFTTKWLLPRIADFNLAHPDIIINLTERPLPFVFGDAIFDAAIHFSHPAWTGHVQELLFKEELVVVCSPTLLSGRKKISVAALTLLPLLHKNTREDAWSRWFALAGMVNPPPMIGPRYDHFSMIIQAACLGMGVALVPRLYVEHELRQGTLAIPVTLSLRGLKQYCIVYPEGREVSEPARFFFDWLVAAARTKPSVG